ncbi:MAG: DUF4277 domain-containing protein [Bdellovibrionota bacterium]
MVEIAGDEIKTKIIDHHGIVAGTYRELKIIERINSKIGSSDPRRNVQPGVAVVAMILNALGFTNRRFSHHNFLKAKHYFTMNFKNVREK